MIGRPVPSRPTTLACGVLMACAACTGDGTAPDDAATRILLGLRLPTYEFALEGGLSTLSQATLEIRPPGDVPPMDLALDLTAADSVAVFDLTLDPGLYDFAASLYSSNDTMLYQGSAQADINQSGFEVEIGVDAMAGVLVVNPGEPVILDDLTVQLPVRVRNVGSTTLAVDSPTVDTEEYFAECIASGAPCPSELVPGYSDTFDLTLFFSFGVPDAFVLTLVSTVGVVDVEVVP